MPRPSLPRYDEHPHTPSVPQPAALGARLSETEPLQLTIPADEILTACWAKACDFARNFGTSHISVELLLLGACHVRDAEQILADACETVETLSNTLTSHCAKRSFATMPQDTRAYTPNKTLKCILCRAAAIAAQQEMPRITLSLLLEALTEHKPRLPVLDHLATLSNSQPQEHLLADLNTRLDRLHCAVMGTKDEQAADGLPSPLAPTLADAINRLLRDVSVLKGNLLSYPSGPIDSYLEPHLTIPTTTEFRNLLDLFQERLAPLLADAVVQHIDIPKERAPVPTGPQKRKRWPFKSA